MLTTLNNICLRLLLTCSATLLLQVSPVEAQPRRTLVQLQQQIDTLTQLVNALVRRVDILEGRGTSQLPACITTEGNDVVFNGCNVHIRDGSGDTEGATNGLGNLIIGYNEDAAPANNRMGSHNVVIGSEHTYSSHGGLVAGFENTISGPRASVSGGFSNEASATNASVSGGQFNIASGDTSSISGGTSNEANGRISSISGGQFNVTTGLTASVSGGANRVATGLNDWRAGDLFQDN